VTSAGARFALKRVSNTLKLVFRNKMAVVGLILLAGFVFMALAAPLLTSNIPAQTVSGNLAQPEWVMNFPDGYYLSKNLADPATGTFTSPASIQAWTLSASPVSLANVQESYSRGVQFLNDSKGSLQLTYTGNTPGTVRVLESFQFPYRGPPYRFIANIHYLLGHASNSTPVNVKVFIERSQPPGVQDYYLVNKNDTQSGLWLPTASQATLDSQSEGLAKVLGFSLGTNPAPIIFSQATSYSYGIQVTFYGRQTINIDDFRIQLLGTAYGLLGTDYSGADVLSQTVYGSRISLFVGLLSAGIGIGLGLVVGLLAGFLGKFVDEVLMRFTDMMLVIPGLPLLIVLVAVLGPNIWNIIIIIGFLGWMGFARIIRAQVLTLRERPFIEAAKASGAGPGRIIMKHVFPNIVSLTYVNLALSVPAAILTESALAFLGLSDPSVVSWGHMFENVNVSGSLSHFPPTWWWVLPPGLGIALVSLSFILIGYALDEIFNPRLRRRR
jgi:ABC-type dipeptide/oligopeptide/nickel transport system permease subunit